MTTASGHQHLPRPSSAVVVRAAYKQYGQTAILKDLNVTVPNGKM